MYNNAKEIKPILIGEFRKITFTRKFKYLGSYILYSLKYDYDIEHRISQASSAMGTINSFWFDNTVGNFQNTYFFVQLPATYFCGDARVGKSEKHH